MAIKRTTISAPKPPAEYTADHAARDARRIAEGRTLKTLPLDVEALASSIGVKVEFLPLPDDVSGFLQRHDNQWVIGINAFHHKNRQRFTLAHELGHYFLHRDRGEFVDKALFRSETEQDALEYDANKFASILLMPEEAFRQATQRHKNLEEVAEHFGVSKAAARYRAVKMGTEQIIS